MSEASVKQSAESVEENINISGDEHDKSKVKLESKTQLTTAENASVPLVSESGDNLSENDENMVERENLEGDEEESDVGQEQVKDLIPKPIAYIEMLDAPRQLQEPIQITFDYLKQISEELGLIKLCWPDLLDVAFEDRTNFPDSYTKNSNKEKLLLLYAENFRRQFCYQYPNRKPLFLACDNECGMQKMVCTTIRPTTLPYSELETWENCARFVGDHLRYELLDDSTLIAHHWALGNGRDTGKFKLGQSCAIQCRSTCRREDSSIPTTSDDIRKKPNLAILIYLCFPAFIM